MSAPKFTPGPWHTNSDGIVRHKGNHEYDPPVKIGTGWREGAWSGDDADEETIANARLAAAAPELYGGCNAMLGLVQLILGRDDLSAELREVLTTNHRIAEAEAATTKARGEAA